MYIYLLKFDIYIYIEDVDIYDVGGGNKSGAKVVEQTKMENTTCVK